MTESETHTEKNPQLSRRDFLKVMGVGLATMGFPRPEEEQFSAPNKLNVDINFFYVWHTEATDLAGFDEALRKCDVFSPEFIDWTPDDEKYLNDVSKGFISFPQIESDYANKFYVAMLKKLWNTRKIVKLLDIQKGHPLVDEFYRIKQDEVLNFSKSYDRTLLSLTSNLQTEAEWMRRRENFILNNLGGFVDDLKHKSPFKEGRKIKVMMEYGLAHTRMLHQEKAKEDDSKSIGYRFPASLSVYLHSTEALRRYYFAQDYTRPLKVSYPDRELSGKVVMEKILINWLYPPNAHHFKDTAQGVSWFRELVERVSKSSLDTKTLWEIQKKMRVNQNELKSSDLPVSVKLLIVKNLKEIGVSEKYLRF